MQFDRFTIALLILRPDAAQLDDDAAAALQDAHWRTSQVSTKPVTCWPPAPCSTKNSTGSAS